MIEKIFDWNTKSFPKSSSDWVTELLHGWTSAQELRQKLRKISLTSAHVILLYYAEVNIPMELGAEVIPCRSYSCRTSTAPSDLHSFFCNLLVPLQFPWDFHNLHLPRNEINSEITQFITCLQNTDRSSKEPIILIFLVKSRYHKLYDIISYWLLVEWRFLYNHFFKVQYQHWTMSWTPRHLE